MTFDPKCLQAPNFENKEKIGLQNKSDDLKFTHLIGYLDNVTTKPFLM